MLKKFLLVLIITPLFSFGQIYFENDAIQQNIECVFKGTTMFGGGVSFCDFNGDGWDDISFTTANGDSLAFYQNNQGVFSKVNLGIGDTSNIKQINWVDIDNDGDKDLFFNGLNGAVLYENQGNMQLIDITLISGITATINDGYGASWGDYNNDGFLDVYLSNRVEDGVTSNVLCQNNGNNTFTDVTLAAGLNDTNSFSFCAAWFDFNNDGWQDIYSTTDKYSHSNKLYKNNQDGTFTDVSVGSNTSIFMDAMCATVEDYNADGWLDFYVTNTAGGNILLKNNGNETFTENAPAAGVAYNGVGWGAAFLDVDNDKDLDLYVSGMGVGAVHPSSILYENNGLGSYSVANNCGFEGDSVPSFGNAIGDFNNDGYFDIAVSNMDTNVHLWKNGGGSNNWIKILLTGTTSNRDGIGSWIKVYIDGVMQTRYTLCGESYASQFSNSEIIGVGSALFIDSIEVVWLSGHVDKLYEVPTNQELNIVENQLSVNVNNLDLSGKNGWEIFPNPSANNFLVRSNKANQIINEVIIYDVNGKVSNHIKSVNLPELNINIEDIPNGTYFVKIISNEEATYKKLLITH
ncbi:MAG: FG-GAP-like repeat-containing protein [Vicingaceae bacterium]